MFLPRRTTLRTPLTNTSTFVTRLRPGFSLKRNERRSTQAGFAAAGIPSAPTCTTPMRMRCGWSPTCTRGAPPPGAGADAAVAAAPPVGEEEEGPPPPVVGHEGLLAARGPPV